MLKTDFRRGENSMKVELRGLTKQFPSRNKKEKKELTQEEKEYMYGLSNYKTSYQDAYNKAMGGKSSNSKTKSSKPSGSSGTKKQNRVGSVSNPGITKNFVTQQKVASAKTSNDNVKKKYYGNTSYSSAYSKTMSSSGGRVACPKCGQTVTPTASGKCPICGAKLS